MSEPNAADRPAKQDEARDALEARLRPAARDAFRVVLADALRPLADPLAIQAVAASLLGAHLGVSRAFYAEGEPDGEHVVIHRDYTNGAASAAGRYALDDFGRAVGETLRAGGTLAVDDVTTDPGLSDAERASYASIDVRAHATVALVKGGQLVALLGFHHNAPRAWAPHEIALVEETAERTWAAVERARAEAQIRSSEADFRFLSNLGELIRTSEDASSLLAMASELIGQHLHATRCCFAELDETHDRWRVEHDYHAESLPSMAGEYRLSEYAPVALAELRAGRVYASANSQTDPRSSADYEEAYAPLGIRSLVVVPFRVDGVWVANLITAADAPRAWAPREVALLETAAERVWLAAEKLRATAALRASEERLQVLYARERAARAQAEDASRLKDEFLATVTHELRTPLTAILGYGHLLQSRKRDEAYTARAVETIMRNAKAQGQLIEDLLDVSRAVTGKLRLETGPVDLGAVVEAASESLRPAIDEKALRLQLIMEHDTSIVVGDPNRLQQVAWNLLSNAIKFTPQEGVIIVEVRPRDGHVQLIVRDSGQGISADFLPYVFERFRQADSSSLRANSGLGLGLAIVRHIVELHGGTIRVQSDGVDHGATFTVTLPRILPTPPLEPTLQTDAASGAANERPPVLGGVRVLVVDDQPDILAFLEETLRQSGAVVEARTTARDALAALGAWLPDVLVSDIAMPGEDGYWLIDRVRALPRKAGGATLAVALTAYVRVEEQMRVLGAGFQHYVSKPIDPAELEAVVASLVRSNAAGDD